MWREKWWMSTSLIKIVHAEIYQNNLIYFRISIIISRKRSNILPSGEEINMKTCKDAAKEKRPLPVGVSDYVRAQAEYYYVDKTLLIKEFLDRKPLVSLFTRPRRFGKTLNMDMLRVFFEISDEDISIYFKEKAIWKCGQEYTRQQGNNSSV
jgi:hypothetical protein